MGGQVSWLLPAALIGLAAGLWLTRSASPARFARLRSGPAAAPGQASAAGTPPTLDPAGGRHTARMRGGYLLWGGWLLVTAAVFSYARGIIHPYYTVALAPAIGALVGMAATGLWARRESLVARVLLAGMVAATAAWSYVLLDRTPAWLPWLRAVVLLAGAVATAGLLGAHLMARRAAAGLAAIGLVAALAGPVAYSLDTAATPHSGAIPSAGPATLAGFQPGGQGGARGAGGFGGQGTPPGGATGQGGFPGIGAVPAGGGQAAGGTQAARGQGGNQTGGGPGGGFGSLLGGGSVSSALVSLLEQGGTGYTWAAATVGATSAAGLQLASGEPIMAIGGFNGTDPAPTLAQFEQWVRAGKVHYFITGSGFGRGGVSAITSWVEQHYPASTVGGTTVYDLSTTR